MRELEKRYRLLIVSDSTAAVEIHSSSKHAAKASKDVVRKISRAVSTWRSIMQSNVDLKKMVKELVAAAVVSKGM